MRQREERGGAALVEFAIVVPVFGLFLMAMMEFGHVYMVQTTMRASAKKAARYGIANGVTTSEVEQKAREIVAAAVGTQNLNVMIKDASIFDDSDSDLSGLDIDDLPEIELADAETRQLYIVRLELPYDSVALLPPFWVDNVTLHTQAVMRHE